jgi:hypothetical protein
MMRFLGQMLRWLSHGGFGLLLFAGGLLLVWGTFAPVGTLTWWLEGGADEVEERVRDITGRTDEELEAAADPDADDGPTTDSDGASATAATTCFIVFLTGVGDTTAEELASGEEKFLDQLDQNQEGCTALSEVFPYSAANPDVGGQRIFEFLEGVAEEADGWLELTNQLLRIRNLWRMALSADNRYGPVYNRGIALEILEQMDQQQALPNNPDQPIRLILIGTSGGVQVALAASPYLSRWLPMEITVVSMGGVFNGDEGFDTVKQFYHFRGEDDWVENVGAIIFPYRWRWTFLSPFNRARRQDRFHLIDSGPHEHDGDRGYFGEETVDGEQAYYELSVDLVNELPIWPESE